VLTHASPIAQSVGMLRWKTVLIAAVCGAAAAVLFTSIGFHTIISGPFFARDSTLLSHRALYYACLGCWVIFSLYWENAAKNSAPAKSSEAKTSRGVHVFLTNVALVLIAAPIHGFGRFVPARPLVMAAGLALEIAGLSLAIWARRHLGQLERRDHDQAGASADPDWAVSTPAPPYLHRTSHDVRWHDRSNGRVAWTTRPCRGLLCLLAKDADGRGDPGCSVRRGV
jgi:hypothetical protein